VQRVETTRGAVSVAVEIPRPARPTTPAVVVARGAGGDRDHPSVVAVCEGIRAAGYPTVRFNFPYREAGRRAPDRQPVLLDCYRAVLATVRTDERMRQRPLVIGGRSMGGRMASILVADGEPAAGLLLLAFPLHAPKRAGTERAAHLARVGVPMLFVQGTRDALATWSLIEPLVAALPGATLHPILDGDHGFRVPKRRASAEAVLVEVVSAVTGWLAALGRDPQMPGSDTTPGDMLRS
jgi:predicted alpha/beta-hydrolase family hydrolase